MLNSFAQAGEVEKDVVGKFRRKEAFAKGAIVDDEGSYFVFSKLVVVENAKSGDRKGVKVICAPFDGVNGNLKCV